MSFRKPQAYNVWAMLRSVCHSFMSHCSQTCSSLILRETCITSFITHLLYFDSIVWYVQVVYLKLLSMIVLLEMGLTCTTRRKYGATWTDTSNIITSILGGDTHNTVCPGNNRESKNSNQSQWSWKKYFCISLGALLWIFVLRLSRNV